MVARAAAEVVKLQYAVWGLRDGKVTHALWYPTLEDARAAAGLDQR